MQRNTFFSRHAETALHKVDGDVFIRDIFATQKIAAANADPNGEYNLDGIVAPCITHNDAKTEDNDLLIARMIAHIELFARHASKQHLEDNFGIAQQQDLDSNYLYPCYTHLRSIAMHRLQQHTDSKGESPFIPDTEIKQEITKILEQGCVRYIDSKCTHNITRLSFDDGAFFPNSLRGPLDEKGFGELISQLETLAMRLPPNLHLVLPTIPLKTSDNIVHLQTIYIQCGPSPQFHVITKAINASIDPKYKETKRRHFLHKAPRLLITENDVDNLLPAFACSSQQRSIALNYNNMVRCQTAGGYHFWSAVEICNTHKLGAALSSATHTIGRAMDDKCEILPEKVTHILVSNPQRVRAHKALSNIVVHVDPKYKSLYCIDQKDEKPLLAKKVTEMPGRFGGTVIVSTFEQRAIDSFQPEILDEIKRHNIETALLRYTLLKTSPCDIQPKTPTFDDEKQIQMLLLS